MSGTAGHTYAVECYEPGVQRTAVERAADRVRQAAATLRAEDRKLEYLETLLMPEDEIVFHLFEADGAETVREASARAEVAFERVLELICVGSRVGPLQK